MRYFSTMTKWVLHIGYARTVLKFWKILRMMLRRREQLGLKQKEKKSRKVKDFRTITILDIPGSPSMQRDNVVPFGELVHRHTIPAY